MEIVPAIWRELEVGRSMRTAISSQSSSSSVRAELSVPPNHQTFSWVLRSVRCCCVSSGLLFVNVFVLLLLGVWWSARLQVECCVNAVVVGATVDSRSAVTSVFDINLVQHGVHVVDVDVCSF